MQQIFLKKISVLVFAVALLIITGSALADAPLRHPYQYMVCSKNAKHCAVVDPLAGVSVYEIGKYEIGKEMREPLWRIKKWAQWGFLSDGGRYFVEPYHGLNLLPIDYNISTVMLKIWKEGKLQYSLKLRDIFKDFGKLERTVSHYHWGFYEGFDDAGNFIIKTVEKRSLAIDIKTGKITQQ
jgi:hypothetical protein